MEVSMNNNYMRTLLLLSLVLPMSTWCRDPLFLSPRHIEQVKQKLKYEESRVAKLKSIALAAATGGTIGLGYYGYKWLKEAPVPEAQPAQIAQPQPAPQNKTGIKAWLFNQILDMWQLGGRFAKHEVAYRVYSSILNKLNDLYTDRTLDWFMQRRTILQAALDNFDREVVSYSPQDQDSKDQLENACRCVLAELESILGFIQYTTERAQAQLQPQLQASSSVVSKIYLTRLRISDKKIKAIATRLIEHVALLLDYDQDYNQKRSMHTTVMRSLINDLTKEITIFKQFEQKVKTQDSGFAHYL